MSNRAASFVEQWVSENAVKPIEGAAAGDDFEARLRAEACLAAAKDEGIAREDIEEETGDLVAYMGAVIANLVNYPERGAPSTDDNRQQLIRTKAFYIWLDEGCPGGARMRIGIWRLSWLQPKRAASTWAPSQAPSRERRKPERPQNKEGAQARWRSGCRLLALWISFRRPQQRGHVGFWFTVRGEPSFDAQGIQRAPGRSAAFGIVEPKLP